MSDTYPNMPAMIAAMGKMRNGKSERRSRSLFLLSSAIQWSQ